VTDTSIPRDLLAHHGFNPLVLVRLDELVKRHIREGRHPGAQLALAKQGKVLWAANWGEARTTPEPKSTDSDTLWLMYSGTKVLTSMALWCLVDAGALSFTDRVATLLPGFAKHSKDAVTVLQLLTHQGGFPSCTVSESGWGESKAERLRQVCDFELEWEPGTRTEYHVRGAHWVVACIIEALTDQDYRHVIRERVLEPLGVANQVFVGVPEAMHRRIADSHDAIETGHTRAVIDNDAFWRGAGIPASGGYATASGLTLIFQAILNQGHSADGSRIWSRRLLEFVLKNRTGEWVDPLFGSAMHRGLGPHLRGGSDAIRTLGSLASPRTFGQGGVGTSMWWADPDSGVSFAYLTNCRQPEPWHTRRAELISNLVHSAIL
jgi:CubicO group peptidase (beta-lactamase class C family)